MNNKVVELLAPAKNLECAVSAINYGADAVYIGANSFGARHNASNDLDDIEKLVQYAHRFYAKVYCTVNTIIEDSELKQVKDLIFKLYEIGVDAIIVQDMALLNIDLPPIPIHASTQCDIRTLEKVRFFENIGLQRVIPARELSLLQLEEICKNTSIEIETFIHGALCVSYSGQCYLSEYIGNRSANRGCCAQPCRKKYSLVDENGKFLAKDLHLLSLKDFNASKYIEQLINIGVSSFKIEGRLKDENYIKNVVAYYRKLIDKYAAKASSGFVEFDFLPDVSKSFNRGFTTYCLDKNRDIYNFKTSKSTGEFVGKITKITDKYFEIEGKNLKCGDGICFYLGNELSGFFVNKVVGNRIFTQKIHGLKIGQEIYRNFDIEFEKILKTSKTKRRIVANIVYENNIITISDEDNNKVEYQLNLTEVPNNPKQMVSIFIEQMKKSGETDFMIKEVCVKSELPFIKIAEINSIRRNLLEELMQVRLKNYKRKFQHKLNFSKFPQRNVDYRANIHNNISKDFYEKCDCIVDEKSFEKDKKVKNLELMRTKHCLYRVFNLCRAKKKLYLIDEKGTTYELNRDCENCEMFIKPLDLELKP